MFEIIDQHDVKRTVYAVNGQFFLIYVGDAPGEWLQDRGWQYLPMDGCFPARAMIASPGVNRCVSCGAIIPEGRQVCGRCSDG